MRDAILAHVGRRIRLYRRSRGMNLSVLAEAIGKSKASLSKYESGQVSVDIVTLFEIAEALEVSPAQLFDYEATQRPAAARGTQNPFLQQDQLHLYHMHRKKVYFSLLKLGGADDKGRIEATLFYKADSPAQMERCDCIYHGTLQGHDTVISVMLTNYHNPVESVLLNFTIPMRKADILVGMISGLEASTYEPTAYKMLLAKEPLEDVEALKSQLAITTEAFREMRQNNMMFIPFR